MENLKINKELPIFWKGRKVKKVNWNTLNFGGKVRIKVKDVIFEVDINELSN